MSESTHQARILVVDDDETERLFVSRLLEQKGYEALTAATAGDAVKTASSCCPDLILLDVMLPDADGFSVCARLKSDKVTEDIPVIFLTAKGHGQEIVHGFEAGGVDYVVKPFDVSVLLARVATHTTLARLSRGLQEALDERTVRLEQANRRLRELNVEMASLEERQRRQLAQELHDTTIQQLVLSRIIIESEETVGERSGQVVQLLDESLQQLRTLVFELSPPVLSQSGLAPAVEWLAERLGVQWGLSVAYELIGEPVKLPQVLELTLFQGIRELLINTVKHADARRAWVTLLFDADNIEIVVADDGRGFAHVDALLATRDEQPSRIAPTSGGYGLYSLKSRLELLGGTFDVANRPSGGAEVRIVVPMCAA
ncbi:MAG: response regulator [Thiohalocapsa sp.]|nr:response regulator [Thiohalocapsa sp.]MCF7991210.1 response regulator [Thiohalocapsa sp.]